MNPQVAETDSVNISSAETDAEEPDTVPVLSQRPDAGNVDPPDADPRRDWPVTAVRVTFGLVWLVDAILKWQPTFRRDYLDSLKGGAAGQASWLRPWFDFCIRLQRSSPHSWAYLVAVTETLIALAVIFGFARKVTYISGAMFSVLIWATAEGFGGPYTSATQDVGTALIYALVFLSLLVISAQTGTSRYSLDAVIERRWPGWARVAEVRQP